MKKAAVTKFNRPIILLHGGMHGGWYWSKLIRELDVYGQRAIAPTFTGMGERNHLLTADVGLDTHIKDIVSIIEYEGLQQVILVGHSYAGMVLVGVADALATNISQLVFIDALIPDNGQCVFDLIGEELSSYFLQRAIKQGDGCYISHNPDFYDFKKKEDREWCEKFASNQPLKTFIQPIQLQNEDLNKVPTSYIRCTKSSFILSMYQKAQAKAWSCYDIPSGHFPMITMPKTLAKLLIKISNMLPSQE